MRLFISFILAITAPAFAQAPATLHAQCVTEMVTAPPVCGAVTDARQFSPGSTVALIGPGGVAQVPAEKYLSIKAQYDPAIVGDTRMCDFAAARFDDPDYLAIAQTLWGFGPDATVRQRVADVVREPGWYAGQVMRGIYLSSASLAVLAALFHLLRQFWRSIRERRQHERLAPR